MIESGFWYFHPSCGCCWPLAINILPTGNRYGLRFHRWIDWTSWHEEKYFGAIRYLRDLYQEFGSWYLVATSYNMGENGLRRQIPKYRTKDFCNLQLWELCPQKPRSMFQKLLPQWMISKSPSGMDFVVTQYDPLEYEVVRCQEGQIYQLWLRSFTCDSKIFKGSELELILGYVPNQMGSTLHTKFHEVPARWFLSMWNKMKNPRRVASSDY